MPFITRTLAPFEVLSEEGLALIEENADTILEQVGIDFRDAPDALELFRGAGADVDGERVRFPRGLVRQLVQATAPQTFTQVARNPEHNVVFGGANTIFAPAYGSPFVRDLDGGRRYGTIEDFRNFVKLAYASPYIHHSGGTVCEPVDLPVNKRHYDMVYAHLRYTDKAFMGSVTHPQRARDTVEMARIVFGADFLEEHTVVFSLINANSPLVWDSTMLGAARAYAEANQAVMMTPFILAGAMSPATVAGTCAQTLAESVAGMAYVQLVRPGAPVVLGSFASSMSMQSGAPTFGTPEPALVLYVMAALARRLGVPFRSGGALTAAKTPDAQAAYESANTMQPTMLGGVNFVLHAAGWLEGGLAMGYEKFVLDADQLGMWHAFAKGVDMSPNGQALDAFLTNEPGTHFLGHPHTLANFETAFYRSPVADNASFEQWQSEGSLDAAAAGERALEEDAGRVRGAAARRGRRRGAPRVDRAEEGVVPGLRRLMAVSTVSPDMRLAELLAPAALRGAPARRDRGAGARARAARREADRHRLAAARARSHAGSRRPPRRPRLRGRAAHLGPARGRPVAPRGDRRPAGRDRRARRVRGRGRRRGACRSVRRRRAAARGDGRARSPVRRRRHHRLPGEPPADPDETTIQAMFDKARFATYIVSQICFDSRVTVAWIERGVAPRDAAPDPRRHPRRGAAREARAHLGAGSGSATRPASCARTAAG